MFVPAELLLSRVRALPWLSPAGKDFVAGRLFESFLIDLILPNLSLKALHIFQIDLP